MLKLPGMKTSSAALAAALLGLGGASAQDSTIQSVQASWAEARAQLNAEIDDATGDMSLTAAAINNSFSADLGGAADVASYQYSARRSAAELNLDVDEATGDLTATAAAIGNSASVALQEAGGWNGYGDSRIVTSQVAVGNIRADLNLGVDEVTGDVSGTAAAIGNSVSVTAEGDRLGPVDAVNRQFYRGDVVSELNAHIDDVSGDVSLTSAAIANSATYEFDDVEHARVSNFQSTNIDPRAYANVGVEDTTGDVSVTAAAISNSLSVSTLPATADVQLSSTQLNGAYNGSEVNVTLDDITGAIDVTSAAIGNSVSVTNLTDF